jgi:hypothetical protein
MFMWYLNMKYHNPLPHDSKDIAEVKVFSLRCDFDTRVISGQSPQRTKIILQQIFDFFNIKEFWWKFFCVGWDMILYYCIMGIFCSILYFMRNDLLPFTNQIFENSNPQNISVLWCFKTDLSAVVTLVGGKFSPFVVFPDNINVREVWLFLPWYSV